MLFRQPAALALLGTKQLAVHPERELVQAPSRDPSLVVAAEAVFRTVLPPRYAVLVAVAVPLVPVVG